MSFVFLDTETTGLRHGFDQIVHFAAIRTDNDLNGIDRFEARSRLLPHVVPHPSALRTNGLPIARLVDEGLPSHYEMVLAIRRKLLSWSPSIFVGAHVLAACAPGKLKVVARQAQARCEVLRSEYVIEEQCGQGIGEGDMLRIDRCHGRIGYRFVEGKRGFSAGSTWVKTWPANPPDRDVERSIGKKIRANARTGSVAPGAVLGSLIWEKAHSGRIAVVRTGEPRRAQTSTAPESWRKDNDDSENFEAAQQHSH